jgi:antitoxin PrlF
MVLAVFLDDVRVLQLARSNTMESAITSKGQATIPKEIRDHFHLEAGDRVKWFVHPNGHIVALPVLPITALRGIVKSRRKVPMSLKEMDAAIADGATERYRRYVAQR